MAKTSVTGDEENPVLTMALAALAAMSPLVFDISIA